MGGGAEFDRGFWMDQLSLAISGYMLTAQMVALLFETLVPFLLWRAAKKALAKKYKVSKAASSRQLSKDELFNLNYAVDNQQQGEAEEEREREQRRWLLKILEESGREEYDRYDSSIGMMLA